MSNNTETSDLIKQAMLVDEEIDAMKEKLDAKLKERSDLLGKIINDKKQKKFEYKGKTLTIFRKNEGLWSLKGKNTDKDVFKVE